MSRTGDIELLLGSLNDDLPPLGTALRSTSGLAANARKPCPDCGHTEQPGWRVDGFKRRTPCLSCGGTLDPVKRGKGVVSFDPMDVLERPVQTAWQSAPPTRPAKTVRCDACEGKGVRGKHLDEQGREYEERCGYCGGAGRRSVTPLAPLLERDPAELTPMERRAEAGSYRELDAALAQLPGRWRKVVYDVHVNHAVDPGELCDVEAFRLVAGMRVLELVMPAVIRVPGGVRANAKQRRLQAEQVRRTRGLAAQTRDKEIRRLVRAGKPVQWVAGEYGLSVRQVYRLVKGESEAA